MIVAHLTQQGATILSAVILSAGGVVIALAQQLKITRKKVDEVHEALKTNHGKRPGEYIEQIGDLGEKMEQLEKVVHASAITIADHTIADEVNFHELREGQEALATSVMEQTHAAAQAALLAVNAAGRANIAAKDYHDELVAKIEEAKSLLCERPGASENVKGTDPPS